MTCAMPITLQHSTMSYTTLTYESTVVYSCDAAYHFSNGDISVSADCVYDPTSDTVLWDPLPSDCIGTNHQ